MWGEGGLAPARLSETEGGNEALNDAMRRVSNTPLWKLTDAMRGKERRLRVERERAYRASFRPHLQVQTERTVPSPIFVAAAPG